MYIKKCDFKKKIFGFLSIFQQTLYVEIVRLLRTTKTERTICISILNNLVKKIALKFADMQIKRKVHFLKSFKQHLSIIFLFT